MSDPLESLPDTLPDTEVQRVPIPRASGNEQDPDEPSTEESADEQSEADTQCYGEEALEEFSGPARDLGSSHGASSVRITDDDTFILNNGERGSRKRRRVPVYLPQGYPGVIGNSKTSADRERTGIRRGHRPSTIQTRSFQSDPTVEAYREPSEGGQSSLQPHTPRCDHSIPNSPPPAPKRPLGAFVPRGHPSFRPLPINLTRTSNMSSGAARSGAGNTTTSNANQWEVMTRLNLLERTTRRQQEESERFRQELRDYTHALSVNLGRRVNELGERVDQLRSQVNDWRYEMEYQRGMLDSMNASRPHVRSQQDLSGETTELGSPVEFDEDFQGEEND